MSAAGRRGVVRLAGGARHLAAVLVLLASAGPPAAAGVQAVSTAPALSIREPKEGVTVGGDTVISVTLTPADLAGAQVVVLVDGRELCRLQRPPWSCAWDAGRAMRAHHVRVVATLSDGRRLVANRRTKGLDVDETVEVSAVQIPVVVTDARGRFVTGLTRDSFTLLENGKPQRIETLIDQSLPLEMLVAVDISASMEHTMADVQAAVQRLLARLKPGDTTTLVGFNETIFVLAERESDPALRNAAVEALVPWGGTAFFDATVRSLDLVSEKAGRRGIIIFSDGDDQNSVGRRDASLRRIEEGQVVVYTVGFGEAASAQFRDTLTAFAESSGGRAYFPRRPEDLDAAFGSILDQLSHQYVLSYVSEAPADGSWRTLEIRACDGCRVRAREGYRAPDR